MKIRENICTTGNRQQTNFHNTLKALKSLKKKQTNTLQNKTNTSGMNRGQTRSTLEKKYKWLNKYEKMVNVII